MKKNQIGKKHYYKILYGWLMYQILIVNFIQD